MEHNPILDLKAPHPSKERDRVLGHDELLQVWKAADQYWFPFGLITPLLILIGQRISEVCGMTREEIDGDVWTIPGERTKNGKIHQVDLHPLTIEVLDHLPVVQRIIITTTGRKPPSGFSKAKRRLDQTLPGISHWRFHDLRRTVASGMAALDILPNVIERVLNHQSRSNAGLVGVYQRHEYRVERRDAIMRWGDRLETLMKAQQPFERRT